MRNNILLIIVFVAILNIPHSWAQTKGQIRVSGGLALGSKAALNDKGVPTFGFGVNIGGDYFITDAIGVHPSYSYFLESTNTVSEFGITNASSLKVSSINVDGKYYFLSNVVNVYGLVGLSIASSTETFEPFGGFSETVSATNVGGNVGVGADYTVIDKIFANAQVKFNTPLEQLVINIGVGYIIK
ncbi:MAG: porin family protein [Cyclobacteriaceae bacterium]|nr:porin family protein [Cyclobacteriaceae bacterium]